MINKPLKKLNISNKTSIKFKLGDIVCVKPNIHTGYGDIAYSFFEMSPMKILSFAEDDHAFSRKGEVGSFNEYNCVNLINRVRSKQYQLDLVHWDEIKDEIIAKFKQHINLLENI